MDCPHKGITFNIVCYWGIINKLLFSKVELGKIPQFTTLKYLTMVQSVRSLTEGSFVMSFCAPSPKSESCNCPTSQAALSSFKEDRGGRQCPEVTALSHHLTNDLSLFCFPDFCRTLSENIDYIYLYTKHRLKSKNVYRTSYNTNVKHT